MCIKVHVHTGIVTAYRSFCYNYTYIRKCHMHARMAFCGFCNHANTCSCRLYTKLKSTSICMCLNHTASCVLITQVVCIQLASYSQLDECMDKYRVQFRCMVYYCRVKTNDINCVNLTQEIVLCNCHNSHAYCECMANTQYTRCERQIFTLISCLCEEHTC